MSDKISVLISEEDVEKRIQEIGSAISKEYEGKCVHLICVLKGGVFFACELAKRISVPVTIDFMSVRTLSYLIEILKKRNPASLKLCTLLDKPERRVKEVHVDYTCFNIPDEFVVGYGLDYAQRYRNLPFIGVVEPGAGEE